MEVIMALYNITTNRLECKAMSVQHLEDIYHYGKNEDVSRFIGWPLFKDKTHCKEYIEEMCDRHNKGTHMYASVFEKNHSKQIGTLMLFNFDKEANKAEVGYVLSHDIWGKGYGTEALEAIINFAFGELKLHKLHAQVTKGNWGSSKILEKCGFTQEGDLIDHYYIDNKHYNALLYGLINKS